MIKRRHAFEFCDLPWIPGLFREGFMDCLDNIHRLMEPYRHVAPIIERWAAGLGVREILDIGSGGGAHLATVLEYLDRQDAPRFILSDLYPQPEAYRRLQARYGADRLGYLDGPVPIAQLPPEHRALTIFSAFHHLPPQAAAALLEEVVAHRDGLCIVEFTRRTLLDLVSMFPAFFINLLAPLTAERFRAGKLLWGTLIPVIPVLVCFDGFVSALRSYTADELMAMLPPGTEKDFVVEHGEVGWGRLPLARSTYFCLSRRPAAPGAV